MNLPSGVSTVLREGYSSSMPICLLTRNLLLTMVFLQRRVTVGGMSRMTGWCSPLLMAQELFLPFGLMTIEIHQKDIFVGCALVSLTILVRMCLGQVLLVYLVRMVNLVKMVLQLSSSMRLQKDLNIQLL